MNKGFVVSGILAVSSLASYFLGYIIKDSDPIDLPLGIKLPGWAALALCSAVVWLMSDEGPTSKRIRDSVVGFIERKFSGSQQPPGGQP